MVFESKNITKTSSLMTCNWETAKVFTHQDEGEPMPAFTIRYYCGKTLGSQAISFTGLCHSNKVHIKNIEFGPRDTQFP